ncbi:DNA recombination protein RmuC [Dermatophilus congolensis]|uniref:DNA recombination protein rmuC n=1 Tax=Dermatophilus congolensis TaxID=1863 RepID=A0A239VR56_9MICO|nr:DNA recombination protein RmuC [Dermatophilus congolensis]MBO3129725.1 DNA recombination protein RmuC [Dermatophilus congolensis]MBO3131645.1 DNA recombination protein RmuC [Dermatophilus congolensis]MBO3134199.1 DNA recombination protein RmuC [Dermatophilus congolensis]MBO3136432.1 DNA recombination protein RmuC [Dermatophilus congolensis]MBO3138681.1 DNA recombination protein RmuC [Dermatophilus congolensis]
MSQVTFFFVLVLLLAVAAVVAAFRLGRTQGRMETGSELAAARAHIEGLREQITDMRAITDEDSSTRAALAPLENTIARVAEQVTVLERDRQQQFGRLGAQLIEVSRATSGLQSETATLAGALKSSNIRGVWGETQLRRVLELSGLERWCDFTDQVTSTNSAGKTVRPDVVVTLPGGKSLVIDSKAPLDAFLQAQGTHLDDDERAAYLDQHAAHLRSHVRTLASKEYWTAFATTPEMVVCFVPGDAILSAALDANPALYEEALAAKVVLVSPASLFALARTVAYVWKQDSLAENAKELLDLGTHLHSRLRTLGTHLTAVGSSLSNSVANYNKLVGTLETRVFVTARKFSDLGITSDEIAAVKPLDATPRPLTAPELLESIDDAEKRSAG